MLTYISNYEYIECGFIFRILCVELAKETMIKNAKPVLEKDIKYSFYLN
jgi:hypothetical protein